MTTAEESAFEQGVVSMDSSSTVHNSISPEVSCYNGTWTRHGILGGGSFGAVYLEHHTETGNMRAVKQITNFSSDTMREINCMIRVRDHSSLFVRIQCWWKHQGVTYIAMDYHNLGDLTRHVLNGPLSENAVRDIGTQLLQAAYVLYSLKIVHRDIKPKNILVTSVSPLRVCIADFGLAKNSSGSPDGITHDNPDTPDGTPAWAAPEQLDANNLRYTSKVDIWSIGCVLYYLMTTLNPFSDDDAYQSSSVISRYTYQFWPRVTHRQFADLDETCISHYVLIRGVSYEANTFLMALITPNPKRRLSSTEALMHKWINPLRTNMWETALRGGHLALMQMLTTSLPAQRSKVYMLRVAAADGYLDIVKFVLGPPRTPGRLFEDTGPVVDKNGNPIHAALIGAAAGGYHKVFKLLWWNVSYIKRGDVACESCQRALEGGHTGVVDELWPAVVHFVNFADLTDLTTALVDAVAAFGAETFLLVVVKHIKSQAAIEPKPYFATMITAAAHNGNIGNLKTLISEAPPGLEFEHSAISSAASSGHLHILKHLLDHYILPPTERLSPGAVPSVRSTLSVALEAAAKHGHQDVINYLVVRGVSPTSAAISAAVDHNHTASFQYLVRALQRCYDLPVLGLFGYIPDNGIPHCELPLLKQHHQPTTLQGHVPAAARLGYTRIVLWLLKTVTENGARQAGLVAAAETGHVDLVRELIKLGSGGEGEALSAAAKAGEIDIVELLIKTGKVTEDDVSGALGAALASHRVGVEVRLTIERGTRYARARG